MIRLLMKAYPREWRRRYGAELSQLVDDTGLTVGTAMDLVRSGLAERRGSLRSSLTGGGAMLVGPAYRHPTGLAVVALLVLTPTFAFVVGSVLAYQLGIAPLHAPMEAASQWLAGQRLLDLLLAISPAIALLLAVLPLVRLDLRTTDTGREAILGVRIRLANVVVGLSALAIGGMLAWYVVFESVMEAGA